MGPSKAPRLKKITVNPVGSLSRRSEVYFEPQLLKYIPYDVEFRCVFFFVKNNKIL